MVKLKRKLPSMIIACFMAIVMMVSVAVPAFAVASVGSVAEDVNGGVAVGQDVDQGKQTLYSPDITVGDTAIEEECDVYVTVAESDIMVTVPKVVILNGSAGAANSGEYTVKVQGDISADTIIAVEPQDEVSGRAGVNFEMSSVGKENIFADVDQAKTTFTYEDGMRADTAVTTTGTITAHGMTAGQWNGNFVFNIGAVGKVARKTVMVDMVNEAGVKFTYGEGYNYLGKYVTGQSLAYSDYIPIENYDADISAVNVQYAVWDSEKNYLRGNWEVGDLVLDPTQGDAYITLVVNANESIINADGTVTESPSRFVLTRDVEVSNVAKTFEIFGDSHSAFDTSIVEGNIPFYYAGQTTTPAGKITDVDELSDMWFSQVETYTGLNLVRNDSHSGSCLSYTYYGGKIEKETSFVCRLEKRFADSSLEDPDMFMIFGGVNDVGAAMSEGGAGNGTNLGTAKYSDWTEEDLKYVGPAVCYMIDLIQKNAPDSEIVFILDRHIAKVNPAYGELIESICDHYGVTVVKILRETNDGSSHPTAEGMTQIKDKVVWDLTRAGLI